jgi:hypothetical protein
VAGQPLSHAQAGEMWLRKYLAKLGKEEKDLAGVLWEKNWTAIAEVRVRFLLSRCFVLTNTCSYATMTSKNTFWDTRPRRRASICTA